MEAGIPDYCRGGEGGLGAPSQKLDVFLASAEHVSDCKSLVRGTQCPSEITLLTGLRTSTTKGILETLGTQVGARMLLFRRGGGCSSPLHAGLRRPGLDILSPEAVAAMTTESCRPPFQPSKSRGNLWKTQGRGESKELMI